MGEVRLHYRGQGGDRAGERGGEACRVELGALACWAAGRCLIYW